MQVDAGEPKIVFFQVKLCKDYTKTKQRYKKCFSSIFRLEGDGKFIFATQLSHQKYFKKNSQTKREMLR